MITELDQMFTMPAVEVVEESPTTAQEEMVAAVLVVLLVQMD
tara:strand:- start:49 stop:174 length:126 start_codon:yes stop_codon:yes gene_type:complete